jgi:hypothetical protein
MLDDAYSTPGLQVWWGLDLERGASGVHLCGICHSICAPSRILTQRIQLRSWTRVSKRKNEIRSNYGFATPVVRSSLRPDLVRLGSNAAPAEVRFLPEVLRAGRRTRIFASGT